MEEQFEQEVHPDYLKGFNEGYLLQRHNPQLAESIGKAMEGSSSQRTTGFIAGCSEYQKEREQVLTVSWMNKDIDSLNDITPEQEMDKDGPEMEQD